MINNTKNKEKEVAGKDALSNEHKKSEAVLENQQYTQENLNIKEKEEGCQFFSLRFFCSLFNDSYTQQEKYGKSDTDKMELIKRCRY